MLLENTAVLVSGVGPGLGQELVRAVLEAGGSVAMACRKQAFLDELSGELSAYNDRLLGVSTDVTDPAQCERFVEAAAQRFGAIDVLINTAYDPGPYEAFEGADLANWRRPLDVNLFGALNMTQAALPMLKQSGQGSVVNVNSMVTRKPLPNQGAYVASKGALAAATKALATELGPFGIRCNSVVMGWMWGDAVERSLQVVADDQGCSLDDIKSQVTTNIPLGRIPEDGDCAGAVVFFASPLSRAVTGASLDVNGGEYMP
jgi:NAD(P)-dependent dehydrogenase (short-subunit alcohol dehydrogenase family)